jgi:internalin A
MLGVFNNCPSLEKVLQSFLNGLKKVKARVFMEEPDYGLGRFSVNGNNELTHLKISNCSEDDFTEIAKIETITYLILQGCNIEDIPESIGNLKNLVKIDLADNLISELPQSICGLSKLAILYLDSNEIANIPMSFYRLNRLYLIGLFNNPITNNIAEIHNNLSGQKLIGYFLEIQDEATKPLNEAKILVVGDERVGKTSVINRLLGNKHNTNQQSTFGIDIQRHTLKNDIKINIWDFAG